MKNQTINKWTVKKINLKDVQPWSQNPRDISKAAKEGLKSALSRFGYVELIVFNERTGHIVGGHQRYEILKKEGVESAKMVVVDFSEQDEQAANMTLNNPEIEGYFVDPAHQLVETIQSNQSDIFESLRIDKLKEDLDKNLRNPVNNQQETPESDTTEQPDTVCPCCGYAWVISANNISSTDGMK